MSQPRVHITYDIETKSGAQTKELPFVVGVMGDFSGHADKPAIKQREFITINKENFNQVMQQIRPKLNLTVVNSIDNDNNKMTVNLEFNSMDDFTPKRIAEQIPLLKQLLAVRNHLKECLVKTEQSYEFESLLEEVLQDHSKLLKLAEKIGVTS